MSMVMEIYDDESSVAARCAVRALESSLPSLMESPHGHAALNALLSLLKMKENCYWLVKVGDSANDSLLCYFLAFQ